MAQTKSNAPDAERASARDVQVAIIVYSRFGVLRQLAEALVEGMRSLPWVETHMIDVLETSYSTRLP